MAAIVAAVGEETARRLARCYGGTSIYVPRAIGDGHPLCLTLGREGADRLTAYAGGAALAVPKQAERRRRVRELHVRGGLTIAQIATEAGFSERHVYRLLSAAEDDRQLNFFGAED